MAPVAASLHTDLSCKPLMLPSLLSLNISRSFHRLFLLPLLVHIGDVSQFVKNTFIDKQTRIPDLIFVALPRSKSSFSEQSLNVVFPSSRH